MNERPSRQPVAFESEGAVLQAFDLIPGEKKWYEIEGGHFGLLYHPSDLFDEASSVQADFLRSHLTAQV
jgi:hypothetical protein